MRFKGIVVAAGLAALLAAGAPAQAGGFQSVDRRSGGGGAEGTWSSGSAMAADGAFSVSAAIANDPAATATSARPSGWGQAMATKSFTVLSGVYDITATVAGLNADATATEGGYSFVGLTINLACTNCRTLSTQAMAYAVDSSEGPTSVRGGTLTTTIRVLMAAQGELSPTAVVEARSEGGTTALLDYGAPSLGFRTGEAAASATGVLQAITVTPAPGLVDF